MLTNSDHLQTQAALAADHFGLPGKDCRVGPRAKNKAMMRRHFAAAGVDRAKSAELAPGRGPSELLAAELPCPRVTKPCQGVAGEDVRPAGSPEELVALTKEIGQRRPDAALVDEELLTCEQCDLLLAQVLGTSLFELGQRTYLGEPLPSELGVRTNGVGRVECALADRAGTFTTATGATDREAYGVRPAYGPLRAVGAAHPHHHTDRDCVRRTSGTDQNAVDRAAEDFFASERREIA